MVRFSTVKICWICFANQGANYELPTTRRRQRPAFNMFHPATASQREHLDNLFYSSPILLQMLLTVKRLGRSFLVPLFVAFFGQSEGFAMKDPSPSFRNLEGIIFDIDGTLADSWKLGFDATLEVLEKNGIPPISLETYHECTRYATPDRLARHAGLIPGDQDYESVGEKLATQFDNLYVGLVSRQTAGFYDKVDNMLGSIPSSVKMGALTNACVDYAHAVFQANSGTDENMRYSRRFLSVHGADSVPKPKPAPDGLLQVCQDLSVSPSDCVYVGDSPSDAMAAHNAGMPSIGVLWGSHSRESLENAPFSKLCSSVEELCETLGLAERVQ